MPNIPESALTRLPDSTLAHLVENLERTVASLKFFTTPFGALLLQQYMQALDAARAEAERRRA
jgi:hypothetical protein